MKLQLLTLLLFFFTTEYFLAQESDGVVSLRLPVRNSLTFNRFVVNPTFTFVREQTKYVSLYNKREWVQFDDAPLTYLASFSGRFSENIGAGLSVFQQNYGVLSTFGGIANFAYNVSLSRESNLTFGTNIGAYNSGINSSYVVTNFNDPSLQNIPNNFLLTINPGINLGFNFLDIGLSYNNLVTYNFNSSEVIEDNTESGIQAHIMHTGYLNSKGFFDESKFSGLVKAEFLKDQTIISGIAMLTTSKGVWAQAGYNSVFGLSGGVGLNITSQISVEYNFEKSIGNLDAFGSSHDITLAYRFKNKNYYYNSGDEQVGLISTKPKIKKSNSTLTKTEADANRKSAAERRAKAKEEKLAFQNAKKEARETQARLLAEQKAKQEADAQAKLLAEQKTKEAAEAQAKLLAEQKTKEAADAQARLLAEQKTKEAAEAQARLLAEQKAKEEIKEDVINNPKDAISKTLYKLAKKTEDSKIKQEALFNNIGEIVEIKNQDLLTLKEDNDLNEQGIKTKPIPFKNTIEETNKLNTMLVDLNTNIKVRGEEIKELEDFYDANYQAGTIVLDEVILYYKKTLNKLKAEQIAARKAKTTIEKRLEQIKIATEFERKRRIKRALFDNQEERYNNDRAMLQNIKKTTAILNTPYSKEDFDFGEEQNKSIQILKNINHIEEGYYLIIAIHTNVEKRNEFVRKVVASGEKDIDFFYDVSTSKYFIYHKKYSNINEADTELINKDNKPYKTNMTIIKIENN